MNFKEALIAHLQGEKVEVKTFKHWEPLICWVSRGNATLCGALAESNFATACKFRLAPRTITVNGREVPEPVMQPLPPGTDYFVPCIDNEYLYMSAVWHGYEYNFVRLNRGIVHLTKEAAIAHAKAMLNID